MCALKRRERRQIFREVETSEVDEFHWGKGPAKAQRN